MSIIKNLFLLMFMMAGSIIALNLLSPNGNTVFEINDLAMEFFSVTNKAFAEIGNPIELLQSKQI